MIKLNSIFVFSASFFPTKCPSFYWLCISRYIYSMPCCYWCKNKKQEMLSSQCKSFICQNSQFYIFWRKDVRLMNIQYPCIVVCVCDFMAGFWSDVLAILHIFRTEYWNKLYIIWKTWYSATGIWNEIGCGITLS